VDTFVSVFTHIPPTIPRVHARLTKQSADLSSQARDHQGGEQQREHTQLRATSHTYETTQCRAVLTYTHNDTQVTVVVLISHNDSLVTVVVHITNPVQSCAHIHTPRHTGQKPSAELYSPHSCAHIHEPPSQPAWSPARIRTPQHLGCNALTTTHWSQLCYPGPQVDSS
jgi:hypothetical protein